MIPYQPYPLPETPPYMEAIGNLQQQRDQLGLVLGGLAGAVATSLQEQQQLLNKPINGLMKAANKNLKAQKNDLGEVMNGLANKIAGNLAEQQVGVNQVLAGGSIPPPMQGTWYFLQIAPPGDPCNLPDIAIVASDAGTTPGVPDGMFQTGPFSDQNAANDGATAVLMQWQSVYGYLCTQPGGMPPLQPGLPGQPHQLPPGQFIQTYNPNFPNVIQPVPTQLGIPGIPGQPGQQITGQPGETGQPGQQQTATGQQQPSAGQGASSGQTAGHAPIAPDGMGLTGTQILPQGTQPQQTGGGVLPVTPTQQPQQQTGTQRYIPLTQTTLPGQIPRNGTTGSQSLALTQSQAQTAQQAASASSEAQASAALCCPPSWPIGQSSDGSACLQIRFCDEKPEGDVEYVWGSQARSHVEELIEGYTALDPVLNLDNLNDLMTLADARADSYPPTLPFTPDPYIPSE